MKLRERSDIKTGIRNTLMTLDLKRTSYTRDIDGTGCYEELWHKHAGVPNIFQMAQVQWLRRHFVLEIRMRDRIAALTLLRTAANAQIPGFISSTQVVPRTTVLHTADTMTSWLILRLSTDRQDVVVIEGMLPPPR